jgi:group I intron endonuclease
VESKVGFTEAEGSFYLVSKEPTRIVHAFEITQKLDLIVLQAIAYILGITLGKKKTYYTVVTTNSRSISNIIEYYSNTMKGIKAVEFKIWARAWSKKNNIEKLTKIQRILHRMGSKLGSPIISLKIASNTASTAPLLQGVNRPSLRNDVGVSSVNVTRTLYLESRFFAAQKRNFTSSISPYAPKADKDGSTNEPAPIALAREYPNILDQKEEILKENKGKAGVYMFLHKESKKRYVGSAKNLRKRFMQYFNPNHLKRQDYMYICRAILKHGFPHFTLVVIEYCDSKLCINRENYYITYFKPEYNILPLAGSLSGFKHSLTTREKMSISQKAFDRVGDKNPRFGSVVSESTRLKLSLAAKDRFKEIDVLDLTTNETTRYESTHAAARALGILQGRIANYFWKNQKSPFKGRYVFIKVNKTL